MWQPINSTTHKTLTFSGKDWPILIHGVPKSGSSFFTVALTAEFVRHKQQVIFMSAKGEAIRALQHELNLNSPTEKYHDISSTAATQLEDMQLVTIFKKRSTNLLSSLRGLKDWGERVIVINNVEEVMTPELWAVVKSHQRLVLSGDFEHTKFEIDPEPFQTTVLFSAAPGHWHRQRESLPTYMGDVYQGKHRYQTILSEYVA